MRTILTAVAFLVVLAGLSSRTALAQEACISCYARATRLSLIKTQRSRTNTSPKPISVKILITKRWQHAGRRLHTLSAVQSMDLFTRPASRRRTITNRMGSPTTKADITIARTTVETVFATATLLLACCAYLVLSLLQNQRALHRERLLL
jgi:hypothetical protein